MVSIDSDLDDEQIRLIFSNWEKFKTNKEIIDMIYGLSKVLSAAAWGGLTSAVKIGNRAARKNYTFCDANGNYQYINGQMRSATRDIPYGLATIGLAGCEVIAVYNSMITLGNPQPFNEVADYFEDNGMFASGFFGTHVNALPEYFTDRGYSVTEVRLISGESCIKFDKAFAKGTTAIFSFYTGDGLNVHTVSISHADDGRIIVYNDNNYSTEGVLYDSIEDMIQKNGYIPIVLYVM